MKNPKPTPGRGRPKHRVTSELMRALIAVQDQLARRRARQLFTLQQQHVLVVDVERERHESVKVIDAHLRGAVAGIAPTIAATADEREVYRLLDTAFRAALNAAADELEGLAAAEEPVGRRRPRLLPSRSLPAARARAARLKVELQAFEEAIAS